MADKIPHPLHAKLFLFKTPNRRSRNWYGGFHHAGKFVRRSTRTDDFQSALSIAESWYLDRQYEVRQGKKTFVGRRLRDLVEPALAQLSNSERRPSYIRVLRNYLSVDGELMQFFGDKRPSDIDTRSWGDFRTWLLDRRTAAGKRLLSETSMHQLKNALGLLLRHAFAVRERLEPPPVFIDMFKSKKRDMRPRVYFSLDEQRRLISLLKLNVKQYERRGSRWKADAWELLDFVIFMIGSGLRVGEAMALKVSHVQIVRSGRELCQITVTDGKRGGGHPCFSYFTDAPDAFRRIVLRRGLAQKHGTQFTQVRSSEPLFLKNHSRALKRILDDSGLSRDDYGRKRDAVSLRHTYICNRLRDGVSIFDIAKNTRTSVEVIEKHYAKPLSASVSALNKETYEGLKAGP